ncbi:hypothetical protein AX16_009410 [Volvariella volvacea WC 439]|nr:hypothetical protein AX16_009410 [Volvariella volvacea WC 439]
MQASVINQKTVSFQCIGHQYLGVKLNTLKNGPATPDDGLECPDDYLGPWYNHRRVAIRITWRGFPVPYTHSVRINPNERITRAFLGQKVAVAMMNFIWNNPLLVSGPGQEPERLKIADFIILSCTNVDHSFWEVDYDIQRYRV